MRIVSYNVNGIRSAINKGLLDWIREDQADIYCFQELKAQQADIPTEAFETLGYFTYWFPAQKKGYSGVGIITKIKPQQVVFGCGLTQADYEGRVLQMHFTSFVLVNTYFPSGSSGEDRQAYKMDFLSAYLPVLNQLQSQHKNVISVGDFNICHKEIDIHDPKGNKNSSGFLPEERAWMDDYFASGWLDCFRLKNDQPHQYSWWSFRANARANNKGWRIDYITATHSLLDTIREAEILPSIKHADHCPVSVTFDIKL